MVTLKQLLWLSLHSKLCDFYRDAILSPMFPETRRIYSGVRSYYYLNQNPTSFPVDTDQILRNLQNNLPLVKQDLINTKKWAVAQEKLGLYSEILRYNRLMQDKYNLSLFNMKEEN